jgi:hypothetical protein
MKFFAEMIAGGERDLRMRAALGPRMLRPHDYGKRRVGQPRANCVEWTTKDCSQRLHKEICKLGG